MTRYRWAVANDDTPLTDVIRLVFAGEAGMRLQVVGCSRFAHGADCALDCDVTDAAASVGYGHCFCHGDSVLDCDVSDVSKERVVP